MSQTIISELPATQEDVEAMAFAVMVETIMRLSQAGTVLSQPASLNLPAFLSCASIRMARVINELAHKDPFIFKAATAGKSVP